MDWILFWVLDGSKKRWVWWGWEDKGRKGSLTHLSIQILGASLKRSTCAAASSTHPLLRRRGYSSESAPERKVAVLGAAGGIGQPLALLMKLNPLVSSLSLYDIAGTPGVAADVSHINTRSEVLPTLSLSLCLSVRVCVGGFNDLL